MTTTIERYTEWLRAEKGSSPCTVEGYSRDLSQFSDWLGSSGNFEPESVTTNDIRAWVGDMADKGLSAATLRRKVQSLRSFFQWLLRNEIIRIDPTKSITLPKKRKPLPNFIKEEEMERILHTDNPDGSEKTQCAGNAESLAETMQRARTHLVLTMLYSLGLRQAELLGIKDTDINFHSAELKVTGKRMKQRVVPLPPPLMEEIREWQLLRNRVYPHPEGNAKPRPLLESARGTLSKPTLYRIVREGLRDASTGRKSPHTLRHTFATAMVNDGGDLDAVREMLGHASLATTQVYTHLSISQMLENYKGAHPRTKK